MKKRWLSLTLAALLLLASCSSGVDGEEKPGTENTPGVSEGAGDSAEGAGEEAETEAPETVDPATVFDAPIEDFGGRTLGIAGTSWWGNAESGWASAELHTREMTGEPMNDAVYTRNQNVESKYNVKLEVMDAGTYLNSAIQAEIVAGTNLYDIAYPRISEMIAFSNSGSAYDMNKIDSLDLSKAWWSQFARESLTVHDSIFFISGDMNFMDKWTAVCMFVNKSMAAKYDFTADQLYDLVDSGAWTIDKFAEYTNAVTSDSNGDSILDVKDTWGCSANGDYLVNFLHAWDDPYTKVVDGALVFNLNNEFTINAIDKLISVLDNNVIFSGSWDVAEPVFTAGRALFYIEVAQKLANFRTLDSDFGVLPLVKYDETQPSYRTACATLTQMIAIPKTAADKEYAGYMLGAMGYESSLTIQPAYIENALESKFARDERTADMLGYIFRGMNYEMGYYDESLRGACGNIGNMLKNRSNTAASSFASANKVITKILEKVNAAYENAE